MKALVVYGTKSGCTMGIAEKIGETLAAKGLSVDVMPAEKAAAAADYDAVVVGSGVRAGSWHAGARTWVTDNADALKAMPVAFYTCGLTAADAQKAEEMRAYTDPVIEASGVTPIDVGLFAGWNEPKEFSFVERSILKLMKAPEGDFRDLDAVQAWAEKITPQLGAA
jgi:menaquinone-dependent protoporphyrinogen oxidase